MADSSNPIGAELLEFLQRRYPESTLTYSTTIPARPSQHAPWPKWVLPELKDVLAERGIDKLYAHQAAVAEHAWNGEDVVVATGTSSGKSLGYLLPILSRLAEEPTACALYLTPTKALGSDQLRATGELTQAIPALKSVAPAPYDGDTPHEARSGIRDQSRFIFATPDMLHMSVLAVHPRWARMLRHLRFIVIDECHSYRGVFGANVALVLRRLLRLCEHYGSHPVVISASATMRDPARHAQRLTGRPTVAVTEDGAPTGARTVALWEPGLIDAEGVNGAPVRRAATTESAGLMASLVAEGARTLTFVRSRSAAEVVAMRTAEELSGGLARPDFARRIAAYRAGYLAEDRRALEQKLDDGSLLGVATTSALELGIDVGGLDAVVIAGFPGTVASFWQQAGRAGRRGQGSLVVLAGRDEPMDNYLIHHPEALLDSPLENSVFNPENPYILYGHIYCAAVERPLQDDEVTAFGADDVVNNLADEGLLRKRSRGWFATPLPAGSSELTPETAHTSVSLRGGSGEEVMIVDSSDGRLLGTIDAARAAAQVHPGAVYLHQGESFIIEDLLFDDYLALAKPAVQEYSTVARSTTDIRILGEAEKLCNYSPGLWVAQVDVEVTQQVTGYQVRLPDGTVGDDVAWTCRNNAWSPKQSPTPSIPSPLPRWAIAAAEIPGTLHAAEHAAIGLLPLLATCDRWDIGGVSTAEHADTHLPTIFVYDGHPGGAGFAAEGYRRFPEWIDATYEAVKTCPCEAGCPSCVQSPKCGNGNNPLDKQGAIRLLGALVTMTAQ
ncbi:Helicase/secretion neighborhood putative DEAH-box helicase [Corynebacterium camporealensis]|uniref:DEAD/DEAH box helicase n=1 Tax=Corynebacterium camporealensis TaxID=161896 RepID=UPI000D2100F2|nr:DEAD/DEAH box helicase [Corynebacterium camporealensis]AVH87509.1 Helicase/secretion neighborhood putative DEAH-box helicase [Corynebacterium camporealensis]